MMTEEKVRELLEGYLQNKARKGHLEAELHSVDKEYNATKKAEFEALASPKAQRITDMPHGTTVGNPTAELAVKIADGWESKECKTLRRKMEKIQKQINAVQLECELVEAWVTGLPARERFVIEHKVVAQEYWRDVVEGFHDRFGYEISKETLKRMRLNGIAIIMEIVNDPKLTRN